jgi:transposase InsO family protein
MADIFEENYRCYGYRRLHAMLRGNNRVISEKVVRRLMAEEQLVVKRTRRRRYNSTVAKSARHRKMNRHG